MMRWSAGVAMCLLVAPMMAQVSSKPAGSHEPAQPAPPGLQLQGLDAATRPDPFPPVDPGNFTASSPTAATVNEFLTSLWGYDANRLWRVAAIQSTPAQGVSRVLVYVSDKSANAKVQPTAFFVTPDGKHAIAGDSVIAFGSKPFAENRSKLQTGADGPSKGSADPSLELVEFADMQCPHCKEAQASIDRLLQDFPKAHFVYQNFPISSIHPFAMKAAEYGMCVAKTRPEAFWPFLQAVYDTQGGLTPEEGDTTLKAAVSKAGLDPGAVDVCAATPAIAAKVSASVKLGESVGVDQTPMLAINGHLVPVSPSALPYETIKQIVQFQAQQDGAQ